MFVRAETMRSAAGSVDDLLRVLESFHTVIATAAGAAAKGEPNPLSKEVIQFVMYRRLQILVDVANHHYNNSPGSSEANKWLTRAITEGTYLSLFLWPFCFRGRLFTAWYGGRWAVGGGL